ncbi:MAG: tRNA (adenine(22)-N(1))-methyltransferase TrmK [Planctomycetota bacterium]
MAPTRRLSPRLRAVLAACSGPSLVDVGYDHGLLLQALATMRPGWRLYGVERLRGAPAWAALPSGVQLLRGDGLQALAPGTVRCAVFAGLGEERIRLLLQRDAAQRRALSRLVICPSAHDGRLRPWLFERGWRSAGDRLVRDARRIYCVGTLEPGRESCTDPELRRLGPGLVGDPLLPQWQGFMRRRFGGQ